MKSLPTAARPVPSTEVLTSNPRLMASIWLPFAFAYFMGAALRNINAVLVPELTREFALGAADLGLLTSVYFAAYSLVQLPAGVLLDRFGASRVHAALMQVGAVGCLMHVWGESFVVIALGRALIGVGLSVALMSAAKAFADWMALPRVPLALNVLMGIGGAGSIVAAGPVGWSLAYIPWRGVFVAAAVMLMLASLVLLWVVPVRPALGPRPSLGTLALGFRVIFSSGTFWRLSVMVGMVSGSHAALQSLWIGPWLRDVAGLERSEALAFMTAYSAVAVLGFLGIGALSDRLIGQGIRVLSIYKVHTAIIMLLFTAAVAAGPKGAPVWLAYFAMGSGGPLVLTLLARHFPREFAGRANTASNVLIFSFAFVFQWVIGAILDTWPAAQGRYAAEGYFVALAGLAVLQLGSFVCLALFEKPKMAIGLRRD